MAKKTPKPSKAAAKPTPTDRSQKSQKSQKGASAGSVRSATRASRPAAKPIVSLKPIAKSSPKSAAKPTSKSLAKPVKGKKSKPAKPAKPAPPPLTAKEILRNAPKTKLTINADTPVGRRVRVSPQAAEIVNADSNVLPRPMKVRKEHPEIKENQGAAMKWSSDAFSAFFDDEIKQAVQIPATIHGDRIARWRCECCNAVIPVPRRTTVYHGDYEVVHDDEAGILVNGDRYVPKAYTHELEHVQPGRLRNPWTGKLIQGPDLGTTGTR